MLVAAAATVAAAPVPGGVSAAAAAPLIRVNQVGYPSAGAKRGFLLSAAPCAGSRSS